MIEVELDPTTRHTDPHYKRKECEAKRACKEVAGWQCEWIHPNGQRCRARHGQLRRKKGRHGEPDGWIVIHLHACHVGNKLGSLQKYICFCPSHHTEYDRNLELQEQVSCYRRGYQITSTDALLGAMQYTGIAIWEEPDGYHWRVDGTELFGHRTTAVGAVCAAIRQITHLVENTRCELERLRRLLGEQQISLAESAKFTPI